MQSGSVQHVVSADLWSSRSYDSSSGRAWKVRLRLGLCQLHALEQPETHDRDAVGWGKMARSQEANLSL